jgi:hypothetical protein
LKERWLDDSGGEQGISGEGNATHKDAKERKDQFSLGTVSTWQEPSTGIGE